MCAVKNTNMSCKEDSAWSRSLPPTANTPRIFYYSMCIWRHNLILHYMITLAVLYSMVPSTTQGHDIVLTNKYHRYQPNSTDGTTKERIVLGYLTGSTSPPGDLL